MLVDSRSAIQNHKANCAELSGLEDEMLASLEGIEGEISWLEASLRVSSHFPFSHQFRAVVARSYLSTTTYKLETSSHATMEASSSSILSTQITIIGLFPFSPPSHL
jgi:hypothetical protein